MNRKLIKINKAFKKFLKGTPYRGAGRVIAEARKTARFSNMGNYS